MIYVLVFGLLCLSALFSGLTLGLMSLGPHELKRKSDLGDLRAKKIYAIRRRGNLLLVTLLVGNVASISSVSIALNSIAPGIVAGILTTVLVTVFGEIAPQAIFSRFAMEIGARTAWLVRIIMILLYPVAAPLAWVLDKSLGDELPTIYSRKELVGILQDHGGNILKSDEERIARGALTFSEKRITEVMTPRFMVTGIEQDRILDSGTIDDLRRSGYSRFPVYDETIDHVTGMLYAQQLIDPANHDKSVMKVCAKNVYFVNEQATLDHALNAFIKTKNHLFMVVNQFSEFVGIVAIEDVIEEILGVEIVDEFDKYANVRAVAEKMGESRVPKNTL
ncbi:MAG TPA: CNNM domain-containing protein [Candidatus Saccharimonadia bacterium]|nr:CNNM domain-containing protein [Candidatus Saccharimonadia bacterium]